MKSALLGSLKFVNEVSEAYSGMVAVIYRSIDRLLGKEDDLTAKIIKLMSAGTKRVKAKNLFILATASEDSPQLYELFPASCVLPPLQLQDRIKLLPRREREVGSCEGFSVAECASFDRGVNPRALNKELNKKDDSNEYNLELLGGLEAQAELLTNAILLPTKFPSLCRLDPTRPSMMPRGRSVSSDERKVLVLWRLAYVNINI